MNRSEVRAGVIAFVVATAASSVVLRVGSAMLVGLTTAALTLLLRRLDSAAEAEPDLPGVTRRQRDGARGDVQELAWSLTGRDGRTGERAMRRLRSIGAVRLARHGVDVTDPRDADRAVELIGRRAHAALTRSPSSTLSVSDARHTLEALERLGSTPRTHPERT